MVTKKRTKYVLFTSNAGHYRISPPKLIIKNSILPRVVEFEKNEFEALTISLLIDVYQEIFHDLGLDIKINKKIINRIHVLAKKEFEEKIDKIAKGLYKLGHIYLPRSTSKNSFISSLAHEIAHLYSSGKALIQITESKYEIAVHDLSGSFGFAQNGKFLGINEGFTDIIASIAISKLATRPYFVNGIAQNISYFKEIDLIESILRKKSLKYEHNLLTLCRAYFIGETNFLENIISIFNQRIRQEITDLKGGRENTEKIIQKVKCAIV